MPDTSCWTPPVFTPSATSGARSLTGCSPQGLLMLPAVKIVQLLPGKSTEFSHRNKSSSQIAELMPITISWIKEEEFGGADLSLVVPLAIFFKAQRLWNLLLHMAGERLEAQLCPKSPNLLWKEGLSCFQQLLVMHHEHHPCAQCSRWGVRMMPVCKDKWTLLSWIGFYSHHCHVWGKCESPSAGKIGKKPTGKVKAEMNHRTSHHRMEILIVSTKRGIKKPNYRALISKCFPRSWIYRRVWTGKNLKTSSSPIPCLSHLPPPFTPAWIYPGKPRKPFPRC